jgi:ribonuclease P protein component
LNSGDYDAVFSHAKKFTQRNFLLLVSKNKYDYARLGIIVAKKKVKLAVKRNRIKRITRESFRNNQNLIKNLDVIFLAKEGIDELSNQELRDQLNIQWKKIHAYYNNQ